ncbi:MAG: flavodoxin domain-containing protein [Gemmatimonadaceae bacterium]|nr:flavodoxin domain-containing protein [Chitinophagaceae bacterium]
MLAANKFKALEDLISGSSKEELIWINGYLTGLVSQQSAGQATAPPKSSVGKITIAYGTETGNSKRLATEFAAKAKQSGIAAKIASLDQYRLNDLSKEEYLFVILSTQGEGEPPAAAKKFYDHIHLNGFRLEKLKYSVLALGDTSYPLFCKAGEDVDSQLEKLGGKRLVPIQKCDTDYSSDAVTWFDTIMRSLDGGSPVAQVVAAPPKKSTGKKIYKGELLASINLNDRGSNKETYHIEISAPDLVYQPGDSIGIVPHNPLQAVEAIIALAGIAPSEEFSFRDDRYTLSQLLTTKYSIIHLPERVVAKYAAIVQQEIPATRMDLLDLLRIYPVKDALQFEEVLTVLDPITPRLYSLASSPYAHSDEAHIIVAKNIFSVNEETKLGLCSAYLSKLPVGTEIDFYIHPNNQFRLPANDQDIIMIGPGTGIAPFRSFLADRDVNAATGKNWLFFGEQHFETDFLYQTEIQNWAATGVLTRTNLAFSRDQQEKIYVQHRMQEEAGEIFQWLQRGAYVYVCGALAPMSIDVENTLLNIIATQGNLNEEGAAEYLTQLKDAGRYVKDVY